LENVSDGVIGHVNCRVGERFNNELGVPGKLGTETNSAGTSPFLKPSKNVNEFLLAFIVIAVEIS
jgi:hypothetical protein